MKFLLLVLSFSLMLSSCQNKGSEQESPEVAETAMEETSAMEDTSMMEEGDSEEMIAPENNECICTKEYKPVCGEDGETYGNSCEAECNKVAWSEGVCPSDGTTTDEE